MRMAICYLTQTHTPHFECIVHTWNISNFVTPNGVLGAMLVLCLCLLIFVISGVSICVCACELFAVAVFPSFVWNANVELCVLSCYFSVCNKHTHTKVRANAKSINKFDTCHIAKERKKKFRWQNGWVLIWTFRTFRVTSSNFGAWTIPFVDEMSKNKKKLYLDAYAFCNFIFLVKCSLFAIWAKFPKQKPTVLNCVSKEHLLK